MNWEMINGLCCHTFEKAVLKNSLADGYGITLHLGLPIGSMQIVPDSTHIWVL